MKKGVSGKAGKVKERGWGGRTRLDHGTRRGPAQGDRWTEAGVPWREAAASRSNDACIPEEHM